MALAVKVLERVADDTLDASTVPTNLFASISTGYTGVSGTVTYDTDARKWTLLGNAASTTMSWRYVTSVAYGANAKVMFRGKVKCISAGLTSIKWAVYGSTSGTVLATGHGIINSPAAGSTYDLYERLTLTGLVGNLTLVLLVTDPTSTNTKSVEITDWNCIHLTTEQGAGTESSEADMYAYILFRQNEWTWSDWYGDDAHYGWERADAHGFVTGDTRSSTASVFSSVIRIDANWYAVIASTRLSAAATIRKWQQTDRTTRVLSGTLKLDLRVDREAEVTCDMLGDGTWSPTCGMSVVVYDGTEVLHAGKITRITKTPYTGSTVAWRCAVRIGTYSEVAGRLEPLWDDLSIYDGYTSGAMATVVQQYLSRIGVLRGRIDTGALDIGELNTNFKSPSVLLNELATACGYVWYIDQHRKLHFRDPVVTPADAAHALVDGNGYTAYRNVSYNETTDQYRTDQIVRGEDGIYAFQGLPDVVSSPSYPSLTPPDRPLTTDIEACDNEYLSIVDNTSIQDVNYCEWSAWSQLMIYGLQVPGSIEFDSDSLDWRPNTKLTVKLAKLGMSTDHYFNVDSVSLFDMDGKNVACHVTASQRDSTAFASIPNSGPSAYLSTLQTNVSGISDTPKQERGTFTPELRGSGTAGTWSYGTQLGQYERIGKRVYIAIDISPDSISGSPTGDLQLTGLPFTASATRVVLRCTTRGVDWPASTTQCDAHIIASGTTMLFYGSYSNGSLLRLQASGMSAGDILYISGEYFCE